MSLDYYIKEGNYLVSYGTCSENKLPTVLSTQTLVLNSLAIKPTDSVQYANFRWNILTNVWDDCRTDEQKIQDETFTVQSNRHNEYPSLSVFADAMYWNSRGDPTKLAAYYHLCDEVKLKFPKPT